MKRLPLRNWITYVGISGKSKSYQARGYKNGEALRNHTNNAHQGKIDKKCPACKEILRKSEKN